MIYVLDFELIVRLHNNGENTLELTNQNNYVIILLIAFCFCKLAIS